MNVEKISIIGGLGTGKSTLANNLGRMLNLPVCHLDAIEYFENWEKRHTEERDKIILEKIKEPKWVIDGTYKSTLEKRVEASDTVIFLDYSPLARLKGIFFRYFKNKGKEKPEMPGCKEKMDLEFIRFTATWNKKRGLAIRNVLKENEGKEILIFKKRKELNKWYELEFGKKIEL